MKQAIIILIIIILLLFIISPVFIIAYYCYNKACHVEKTFNFYKKVVFNRHLRNILKSDEEDSLLGCGFIDLIKRYYGIDK